MKNFILFLGFISASAYAQDFVKCDLTINDNSIKCGVFGKCPEKELRNSQQEVMLELHDGQVVSEKINIKRVLFQSSDLDKKVNDNLVFLFEKDNRANSIQKEDVAIREIKTNENVFISAKKEGQKIKIDFRTSVFSGDFNINGEYYSPLSAFIKAKVNYTQDNKNIVMLKPMILKCQKLSQEAINESETRKEMIEELQKDNSQTIKE